MEYVEVNFRIEPNNTSGTEILIAQLSEIGYESFVENDEELLAYIPVNGFQPDDIQKIGLFQSDEFKLAYTFSKLEDQNWNEVWERNFEPVVIDGLVHIRAPFHNGNKDLKYEIIIEPKMSFGTAHHETTALMISMMLEDNLTGLSVLDMGCGTGILAILAEILAARKILAVDIDEWAFENAKENVRKNNCKKIDVKLGNVNAIRNEHFDFIIANINRNVLLDDIETYSNHLAEKGILLLSGFYKSDLEQITTMARNYQLEFDKNLEKNDWVAARFIKK